MHQSSDGYVQSLSQFPYFHQAWLFFAKFNLAQVVGVDPDAVGQFLLTPAEPGSQLSDALSKPFADSQGHARSIGDCDRSHQCL